jgi:hypothetical protein
MLRAGLPSFLTELEGTVLSFLLADDSEENRVLREQLATCSIESRERNGYGVYTNFCVQDSAPRCVRENFELGHISVMLAGQRCGFILFVRDGTASFLEGFPLGGNEWPSTEIIEKVTQFNSC